MQHYTDTILYKTHQHFMILVGKFLTVFIPYSIIVLLCGFAFDLAIVWNICLILV